MNAADARRLVTHLGLETEVHRVASIAPPLPRRAAEMLGAMLAKRGLR